MPASRTSAKDDDIVIVVGARLNSSRLPSKHLALLDGQPLIARIFQRLNTLPFQAHHILATTADTFNEPLVDWAVKASVNVLAFEGDVNNLVARVDTVFQEYQPKILVYVCGDCPLIEPGYITRAISAIHSTPQTEVITCASSDGSTVIHEGMLIYSAKGWQTLVEKSVTVEQKEHVGLGIKQYLNCQAIVEPDVFYRLNHRISVDTAADLTFMKAVYRRWYQNHPGDSIVDLSWLVNELERDKSLRDINAHVQQKDVYKHYGKYTFVCEASKDKGMGQLVRTKRISDRCRERLSVGVNLKILGNSPQARTEQERNNEWFDDEDMLLDNLEKDNSSLLFLDLFPSRLQKVHLWQKLIVGKKNHGVKCIGLDRCAQWHDILDAVIVPSDYPPEYSGENIYAGWHYVIAERKQKERDKTRRILVLTGGSDVYEYGQWLPAALNTVLPDSWRIDWVKGPLAKSPVVPTDMRSSWQFYESIDDLSELMAQAHTAITPFGQSFFELLAAQIPTILLPSGQASSEQRLEKLERDKLAVYAPRPDEDLSVLLTLLENHEMRDQIYQAMAKLPIGQGLDNIVKVISTFAD